jgi:hypothetical protein
MGEGPLAMVDIVAADLFDSIILAASIFHCTVMVALLRVSQNGLTIGAVGGGAAHCPMCGAEYAARLSHLVQCGAVWVFLAEFCPGLAWDYSHPDRWGFLLGSRVTDSDSAGLLALAWDTIAAGVQAGRFAGCGFQASSARLSANVQRSGHSGRLAAVIRSNPPDVQRLASEPPVENRILC